MHSTRNLINHSKNSNSIRHILDSKQKTRPFFTMVQIGSQPEWKRPKLNYTVKVR